MQSWCSVVPPFPHFTPLDHSVFSDFADTTQGGDEAPFRILH